MSSVIRRFVHPDGTDSPSNGRTVGDMPLKTIAQALMQVRAELAKDPAARAEVLLGSGSYAESVRLSDRITLKQNTLGGPQPSLPRLVRPPASSNQGTASTSRATPEAILEILGADIGLESVIIDGEGRPQRGVWISRSSRVKLVECTIRNCHTTVWPRLGEKGTRADPLRETPHRGGTGAGMAIEHSHDLDIISCRFENNGTQAMFRQNLWDSEIARIPSALRLVISDENMRKMTQAVPHRNGGGHIAVDFSHTIRINTCHFKSGAAGGRGGALQLGEAAQADIFDSTFEGNRSQLDGGAICVNDPSVKRFDRKPIQIKNCKFTGNVALDDGGAVYMTSKTLATIDTCEMRGNKAGANGGGLRVSFGSDVKVIGCVVEGNEANTDSGTKTERNQDGGGGIACSTASITIESTRIERNRVHGFAGGGVYFVTAAYDSNAERVAELIYGKTFERILKTDYGFRSARLLIKGVSILDNVADGMTCYADSCVPASGAGMQAGGAGGAVYALESSDLEIPCSVTLDGVHFRENKSGHRDPKQQSEFVVRSVSKLRVTLDRGTKHASNRFTYTLLQVKHVDASGSEAFAAAKAAGHVHEE